METLAINDYSNAFITISKILSPDTEFTELKMDKRQDGGNIKVNCILCGFNKTENNKVIVTTRQHPTKGEQLVVSSYDNLTGKLLKEISVWYYAFNWKGLMECSNYKFSVTNL